MPDKKSLPFWLAVFILAAAGIGIYSETLNYEFAFDEHILITENHSIHSLRNVPEFFYTKFWPGQARGIYYRPVITTSYALDYAFGSARPFIYHATNLAFHVLNCILIFILLKRLEIKGSLLAGLIFAVHPVHTESVTWVSGRTDLLAVFFMLCAWLAWLKVKENREASSGLSLKKLSWLAIMLLAFSLAMLSKETAIVLPVLIFIFDLARQDKSNPTIKPIRQNLAAYIILVIAAGIYLLVRHMVLSGPGPEPAPAFFLGQSLMTRFQTVAWVWLVYLRLLFVPYPLRVDYFYSEELNPDQIPGGLAYLAILFIIFILITAYISRRQRPLFSRLVLAGAVSLLPFSHVISFPTLMAERFLYLTSLFACIGSAWLILHVYQRYRLAAFICAVSLVVLFSALTIGRNQDWRDGFSFWRVSVRQVPSLPEGHNLMGVFAMKRGRLKTAKHEYRAALELDPGFSQARMNLGLIYIREGHYEKAERLLREVIKEDPGLGSAHYNLALILKAQGKLDQAAAALKEAVKLEPENLSAHLLLGMILVSENQPENAEKQFTRVLELDPGSLSAIAGMAQLALERGDTGQARMWINQGLNHYPDNQSLLDLQSRISP